MVKYFESLCDTCSELLSHRASFTLITLTILICFSAIHVDADMDLFHRLATGRIIVLESRFPYFDPFAFTPKLDRWIDHEWLSGVFFFLIHSYSGDWGLLLFRTVTFTVTAWCVIRCALLLTPPSPSLCAWILVCLLHGSFGWSSVVRCQVFTYLFIAWLTLGFVESIIRGRWAVLYSVPCIFPIWCNLHGGFVLGLIMLCGFLGLQIISRKEWLRPTLILVACVASTSLNPYGFGEYWTYLVRALSMPRPSVLEWGPLIQQPDQFVITLALAGFALVGAVVFIRRCRTQQVPTSSYRLYGFIVGLLTFSAYCAFQHARFLVFFMVLSAALSGPLWIESTTLLSGMLRSRVLRIRRVWSLAVVGGTLFSLMVLIRFGFSSTLTKLDLRGYPTDAIHALAKSNKEGRLLLSFNVGAYALWELYPHYLVSMDSRYETVYQDSTVRLNDTALLTGATETISSIDPTEILLLKSDSYQPAMDALTPHWKIWYEDQVAVILTR